MAPGAENRASVSSALRITRLKEVGGRKGIRPEAPEPNRHEVVDLVLGSPHRQPHFVGSP